VNSPSRLFSIPLWRCYLSQKVRRTCDLAKCQQYLLTVRHIYGRRTLHCIVLNSILSVLTARDLKYGMWSLSKTSERKVGLRVSYRFHLHHHVALQSLWGPWTPDTSFIILLGHSAGFLWTSDQLVAKASTYTGQHNAETQRQTNIHVSSRIRTHDPSNQAEDLRFRLRNHRDRPYRFQRPISIFLIRSTLT
jgi:hypothetical protein